MQTYKPTQKRLIRDAELISELYQFSQHYADLLDVAGNREKAEFIRMIGRQYSRDHVTDRILRKDSIERQ